MNLSVILPIALAVAALVVAIVTAYYNKKAIPTPPQEPELTVDVTVTPLLPQGASEVQGKIKIQYEDGGFLTDPRLVEVRLHNIGTAAVSEDMYDGHPYVVRFGTKVVGQLLRQANSTAGKSKPPATLADNELRIGPGAIHAGQRLTYAVLVDGQESIEQVSPLPNIDVGRASDRIPQRVEPWKRHYRWLSKWTTLVLIALATYLLTPWAIDVASAWVSVEPTPDPAPEFTINHCRLDGSTLTCTMSGTPTPTSTPAR